MRALILVALLAAMATTVAVAKDDMPNFKKMRVKQLKEWMAERSLSCPDCADKDDLVRFCTKAAKESTVKVTRPKAPELPLWEAWANNAKEICQQQVSKKKGSVDEEAGNKVCDALVVATDAFFMQYGKRTANKLRKRPDALLKTSYGEIYYNAGRRIFTKLVKHCLSSANIGSCGSSSHIQSLMENDKGVAGAPFVTYITNVGIENTNPMYDILKDKKGLEHDEL